MGTLVDKFTLRDTAILPYIASGYFKSHMASLPDMT